jgi:hypothetical protein
MFCGGVVEEWSIVSGTYANVDMICGTYVPPVAPSKTATGAILKRMCITYGLARPDATAFLCPSIAAQQGAIVKAEPFSGRES